MESNSPLRIEFAVLLAIFACRLSASRRRHIAGINSLSVNLVWHCITHSGICGLFSARFIADDMAGVDPSFEARLWLRCNDLCEQFAGELFGHPIRQGEYERQKADKDLSHARDHRPQPG